MWKGTKGILPTVLAVLAVLVTAGWQQGLEGEVQELDLQVHVDSTLDHIRGIKTAPQAGFRARPDRSPLAGRSFLQTFLDRLFYRMIHCHRLSTLSIQGRSMLESARRLKSQLVGCLRHPQKSPKKIRGFFQAPRTRYAT